MRARTNSRLLVATLAAVLASTCGGSGTTSPTRSSLSAGDWSGTTAQGTSITFTVSSEEMLTTLAVGYRFNGCSGTQTFSNLNAATAPEVTCIPGPCSGPVSSYRAISFSSRSETGSTTVNGVFLPGNRAQGVVSFQDYPVCGTAVGVEWTATRR